MESVGGEMVKKAQRFFLLAGILIVLVVAVAVETMELFERAGIEPERISARELQNNREWIEHIEENVKQYFPEDGLIRVLLMDTGFQQIFHQTVEVSGEEGLVIYRKEQEKLETGPGEVFCVNPDDSGFAKGTIIIEPKEAGVLTISSIQRACGAPSYEGTLELYSTAEGIVAVNELPIESYLCRVVPSEMPLSFSLDALKAQAVCARSYVCTQLSEPAYPEYAADVDDSTAYQVYGNSDAAESTNQAVRETCGQILVYDHQVASTYYYSTSCGQTTSLQAWGQLDIPYLTNVAVADENGDYEKDLPWYRWTVMLTREQAEQAIETNQKIEIGTLQQLEITKTGPGGVALELTATGSTGQTVVQTENQIRRALANTNGQLMRQDGTQVDIGKLLPSAFFSITTTDQGYTLTGGGCGHGIGMSQNGANLMAEKGKKWKEILAFFYPGTQVVRAENPRT